MGAEIENREKRVDREKTRVAEWGECWSGEGEAGYGKKTDWTKKLGESKYNVKQRNHCG